MRTTPSRFTPFALALALAVPSLAAAQPDAGRRGGASAEERAERIEARMAERLEKLREELSLSDAQAARIARIFEESRAEMARLREAGRSPETRQAFRQLRWTTDDRIHEVLSAEQAEQLRQLRRDERLEHREARRGRRGMRGHHGHRGMRGERGPRGPRGERPELTPEQRQERRQARLDAMTEDLGLSAAQRAQIERVLTDAEAQRAEARAQHEPRTPEMREARRQIRWTVEDRIHEVLTPEQRDTLRQTRRERRAERMSHRRDRRGGRSAGPNGAGDANGSADAR